MQPLSSPLFAVRSVCSPLSVLFRRTLLLRVHRSPLTCCVAKFLLSSQICGAESPVTPGVFSCGQKALCRKHFASETFPSPENIAPEKHPCHPRPDLDALDSLIEQQGHSVRPTSRFAVKSVSCEVVPAVFSVSGDSFALLKSFVHSSSVADTMLAPFMSASCIAIASCASVVASASAKLYGRNRNGS